MANKTLNNVKINVTLKSTNTRAQLSTSSEDLAVQMGKINKWYDSLVPTGGATGNILGWNSDGTAKWVTVAPSADKLNVASAVGGTTQPVYFKADGTPEAISFTIGKSVPANAVFTDQNVKSTLLAQSTAEASYRPTFVTGATTGGVYIIDSYKVNHSPGTTSVVGNTRLILGNATASGTANNEEGQLKLYSSGTSFHTLKGTTVSSEVIHVLPSTGGTILNTGTTSYTQTVASSATGAYEIGKIKINGTTTTIYGKDTGTTYTASDGIKIESDVIKHTNAITAQTDSFVFKKIKYDAQGHITAVDNVTASDLPSHTHAYAGSASAGGPATQIATTVTNGTTTLTRYGIVFVDDPAVSEGNGARKNNDFRVNFLNGTTSSAGYTELVLGNNKTSTTANNKYGMLTLYSPGESLGFFKTDTLSENRTYTFPDNTGTVALTSDIVTYSAGTGLSLSGTTFNHTNSITAETSFVFKKIKYDAQGHITGVADVTKSDIPLLDYIPLKTGGGIASVSGEGQNTWYQLATIVITANYVNRPLVFEMSGRGHNFTRLEVMFANAGNTDPALQYFISDGYRGYYIKKTTTSTWVIYGSYTESWGTEVLHRITGHGYGNLSLTINMTNYGTTAPTDTTQVSYGWYSAATNKWVTARTLTIGLTGKTVDGSANQSWSLAEIGALPLTGGTLTGRVTTTKALNDIITGSGTTAQDKGSGVSPRYFPAKWTFNTSQTPTNGDIVVIKIPCAGHDYGVFISINNGTNYHPISVIGTSRLTTHYDNGAYISLIFKSDGQTNSVYPLAGGDARVNVTGGCWYVLNWYDSGNNYDRNRYNQAIKAWGTKIIAGNIIVADSSAVYHHLKQGTAFDITYPILYLASDVNAGSTTTNSYDCIPFTITTTQNITLTAYKTVYIKGALSGVTFTPVSTTPLTQTVPSTDDGYDYMILGWAYSSTGVYLLDDHRIFAYKNGAFSEISHAHPYLPLAGGTMTGQIKTSFNSSIATGSMLASSTTIPNLCEELRYSSGVMGSANITTSYTKDGITVAAAWYNFIWIPHRSGGVNGAASGDNCNYGSLILSGMTGSGAYIVRYNSAISELRNLYKDTTYSANNGVGLSGTTFYNTGVRSTTINGDYLRVNTNGTNADLTMPFATKTGVRWTAVTHGQTWSRIYWATGTYGSPDHYCGTSGLLSISCTRGNVVTHATFLVTSSHAGSNYANCIQLSSGNYTNVKVRLVAKNDSSYYFEIYDDAASIASGTEQSWYCCFVMLGQTDITTYDYFYDGTTVPTGSGYAAMNEFTTTAGSEAAAIKNITRSGTTFTATRQDGSTFTFTQQDNNSDVKVRQTLNTDNKNYPLILSYAEISSTTANVDNYTYRNNSIYANPSEPKIYAASGTANTSPGFSARRTDTDVKVSLMVGSAGANHGVYSHKQSKWLVHADASYTYINSISIGYTLTSSNADAWSSIGVGLYSSETTQLKVFRSDTDGTWPTWVGSSYAAGIAFGGVDTKGGIAIKYNSPKVNFFGGQNTSSVTKPSWYFSIAGTTATNYNLDNFLTSHQTITTGATNGTISVAGTDVAVKGLGTAAYKAESDFAVSRALASNVNLNSVTTPGFYNCGGTNTVSNKPSGVDAFGLEVIHDASGSWYTQILYANGDNPKSYRRNYNSSTWSAWTEDKLTDSDTKNTAGSTDTSSKIFLIGATSQAANPQTYSDNEVYATSGVLTTKSVQVGGGSCTMQYNSTTQSLDFVFA